MAKYVSLFFLLSFFTLLPSLGIAQHSSQEIPTRGNEAPRVSPNAMVSQTLGTSVITVTYGRPAVRDREVFGGLVPFDHVWRTGANESTTLTTTSDLLIGDATLSAGTYSVYSIPSETGAWTLIFNSKLSWGTQYDEAQDVLRVEAEAFEVPFTEWMAIEFDAFDEQSGDLIIRWETTGVRLTLMAVAP